MKIELFNYTCENCKNNFDAPALNDNAYGEFLLWSKNGNVAYLNAIKDPTYKEVSDILKDNSCIFALADTERANILRRIYGNVACDSDSAGLPFSINAFPQCKKCGSQNISTWSPKLPTQFLDIYIPPVTHNQWNSLNNSEKQILVNANL